MPFEHLLMCQDRVPDIVLGWSYWDKLDSTLFGNSQSRLERDNKQKQTKSSDSAYHWYYCENVPKAVREHREEILYELELGSAEIDRTPKLTVV